MSSLLCEPNHLIFFFFFFNDTATTEIYTLSLHDALPISYLSCSRGREFTSSKLSLMSSGSRITPRKRCRRDRKSTRLNSSHSQISYAVFCLKKKKERNTETKHADEHRAHHVTLSDLRTAS